MYVKDWMTKNPICLSPEDSIMDAFRTMKEGKFHRVPIVKSGKLVGLITESDLADYAPSKATTLSVYEINSLLSKTTCEDVMVKNVKTIDLNALLEEAADVMNVCDISCLPVMDDDKLVGIITQKAIFGAFVELMGYYSKGSRIVVDIKEDAPGILKQISTILFEANINITQLSVYKYNNVQIVIRTSETDSNKVSTLLRSHGYVVSYAKTFD